MHFYAQLLRSTPLLALLSLLTASLGAGILSAGCGGEGEETAQFCEDRSDCPEDEIGTWSECSYSTVCDQTGERTREVIRWSCNLEERCSASVEEETDTEGCLRDTEGLPCTNGSCSAGICELHTGPHVEGLAIEQLSPSDVSLRAAIADTGGDPISAHGFCIGTSSADLEECTDLGALAITDEDGEVTFTATLDRLEPLQTYYVQAFAENAVDRSTTEPLSFQTSRLCDGDFVITDDISRFANDYPEESCPTATLGETPTCEGACPGGDCLSFQPYPTSGCGEVTGHLMVVWNDALDDLSILAGLTRVGETLQIRHNRGDFSLQPLESLFRVGDSLLISENEDLTTIDHLNSLASIGADGEVDYVRGARLEITENPALLSIAGFDALHDLPGSLVITKLPELLSIEGFSSLEFLGNTIQIMEASQLHTLQAFQNLREIGYHLMFQYLQELSSLAALSNLEHISGELGFLSLDSITTLADFESLEHIGGLFLWLNDSIVDLRGLENATELDFSFIVWSNPALESISALESLHTVHGQNFFILNNESLPHCEAEAFFDGITFTGDLADVRGNDESALCD